MALKSFVLSFGRPNSYASTSAIFSNLFQVITRVTVDLVDSKITNPLKDDIEWPFQPIQKYHFYLLRCWCFAKRSMASYSLCFQFFWSIFFSSFRSKNFGNLDWDLNFLTAYSFLFLSVYMSVCLSLSLSYCQLFLLAPWSLKNSTGKKAGVKYHSGKMISFLPTTLAAFSDSNLGNCRVRLRHHYLLPSHQPIQMDCNLQHCAFQHQWCF